MKIALVNSRKPRRVCPDEPWLTTTMALGYAIAQANHTLIASVGSAAYEAALFGAAKGDGNIEVFATPNDEARAWSCLPASTKPNQIHLHLVNGPDVQRDYAIIDAADLVIAVAVRAGGQMETLLQSRWRAGKPTQVVRPDETTVLWRGTRNLVNLGIPEVNAELLGPAREWVARRPVVRHEKIDWTRFFPTWRQAPLATPTLAHFTRGTEGPWPGQSPADHWEDLWAGGLRACRDAPATLQRMLETSTLLGSGRLIRGAFPVVSLTAVSPEKILDLHRYRAHLIRWDFEPWGIIFDRNWLVGKNVRPVKYLPGASYRGLTADEKPFFQKHEPPKCDYAAEEEWRIVGDLNFSDAPRDAVRLMVGDD